MNYRVRRSRLGYIVVWPRVCRLNGHGDVEEDNRTSYEMLWLLYLPKTMDGGKIYTLKLFDYNVFTVRSHLAQRPCLPALPNPRRICTQCTQQNDTAISEKYADKLTNFTEKRYQQHDEFGTFFMSLESFYHWIMRKRGPRSRCGHGKRCVIVCNGAGRGQEKIC